MATFTLTNLSADRVHVGDFYGVELAPSGSTGDAVSLTNRSLAEIPALSRTQDLVAAGTITFEVALDAAELSSGMASPPNSVQAEDLQAVGAAAIAAPVQAFFKSFAAGVAGTPDDVTVYAANALPYKMRILDVIGYVSTAIALSTLTVRDEAAGAGTVVATLDSAATGRVQDATATATALLTPGATKGLFVRRSDRGVAGSVIVLARRES